MHNVDLLLPALKIRILQGSHFKVILKGHQVNYMLKNNKIKGYLSGHQGNWQKHQRQLPLMPRWGLVLAVNKSGDDPTPTLDGTTFCFTLSKCVYKYHVKISYTYSKISKRIPRDEVEHRSSLRLKRSSIHIYWWCDFCFPFLETYFRWPTLPPPLFFFFFLRSWDFVKLFMSFPKPLRSSFVTLLISFPIWTQKIAPLVNIPSYHLLYCILTWNGRPFCPWSSSSSLSPSSSLSSPPSSQLLMTMTQLA